MSKFRSEGYKVAAVARTVKDDLKKAADKVITADLSGDPSNIAKIFEEVEKELGSPSAVVYNGEEMPFHGTTYR
jgi:NAD(P)-dependent dehydrogenase (short-subunit alcohol dehydrogenase family)